MHEQDLAIVKALVSVAWADGVFANQERQMLDALLDAYRATTEERAAILAYAAERRTLDDVDPQDLSADDRRILLQHAVLLTFADGQQAKEEAEMIAALSAKLRIPEQEATALIGASVARAKKSLHLLQA
jgi:uncharacterized tellurite resistance protein B-like protein